MSKESLLLRGLSDNEEAQFPELIGHEGLEFELRYHFEPGHPEDGVSLLVPLVVLHQLPHYLFQWLVPGMLRDKCIALIKGLPKQVRRQFVPVPDYIDKVLLKVSAQDRPLTVVLSEQLQKLTGTKIEESSWNLESLDNWYQMNFVLQNDKGQMIAMARSLHQLQRDFKQQIKQSLDRPSEQSIARKGILEWDFDYLPAEVELTRGDMTIKAWPALQDNGESASIELVDNPLVAEQISRHGQLRLALLRGREQHKYLLKNLLKGKELALKAAALGPRDEIVLAIIEASFQQAMFTNGSVVRDKEGFDQSFSAGISQVVDIAQQHAVQVASVLTELHEQQKRLRGLGALGADAQLDIAAQVSWLFSSDTLRRAKPENTQQYPRFVKGISIRIDKLTSQVAKDCEYTAELRSFAIGVEGLREKQQFLTSDLAYLLLDFQWLLEEYRVSLFAQQLKTRSPVSAKRLAKKWSDIVNQLNVF
jgi:ATP-dependent helicase HrpA